MTIPPDIHVGIDGWLFLVKGSNDVLAQYARNDVQSALQVHWRLLLVQRERRLRDMGIIYRHVCVPEKLSIYDNYVGKLPIDPQLSPAYRLHNYEPDLPPGTSRWLNRFSRVRRRRRWRRTMIDLIGPMRRVRNVEPLYMLTDSHWSAAGRIVGYREICRSLGVRRLLDFSDRPSVEHPEYVGDLGAACKPPFQEPVVWPRYQRDAVRIHANSIVAHRERTGNAHLLHGGAHVIYRNDGARDRRKVVLFGDSYAHFHPHMLTMMLAETFLELHFVWSTAAIDWGYVARVKPDIVLTEMAERFLSRLPEDFDLDGFVHERFGAELDAVPSGAS